MTPLIFEWNGEAMVPLPYFAKTADKQFVVHERYRLEVVQQRSMQSHSHFFACLSEAFGNLPESQAGRFATPDHLRKWALCQSPAFRNETTFITKSHAEALRFASLLHKLDEYAIVQVDGSLVAIHTAKSQSMSEMSKKEFQASKDFVLDAVAKLIGTDPATLGRNAGRAA